MFYKIVHELIAIKPTDYIEPDESVTNSGMHRPVRDAPMRVARVSDPFTREHCERGRMTGHGRNRR